MDLRGVGQKNKNKISPYDDGSSKPKRTRLSPPTGTEARSVAEDELYFVKFLSRMKPILSHLVQAEVKTAFQIHLHPFLQSLRESKETGKEAINEPGNEKYKLVFCNQPASTIFTNNEIKAENGEALGVAICDATTNAIICTGLLSSPQVGFFLLDGDYGSIQQYRSLTDFNTNILSPRDGKRPLLVGNDLKLNLENGVGSIKSVCVTDNSSWMKSKRFRLGGKICDDKILAMYPSIGVAVSQPFRVMDHRGEVNKKHHPPSREDEVWRLEGIGKEGAYHKNLTSHGIKTVGDFLKAYHEMGSATLKKLLGNKVPERTWMMMVNNAFECFTLPVYDPSSKANFSANKVMGDEAFSEVLEVYKQKNLGYGYESPGIYFAEEFDYGLGCEGSSPLFTGEASTSYEAAAAAAAAAATATTQALTPNIIKDL